MLGTGEPESFLQKHSLKFERQLRLQTWGGGKGQDVIIYSHHSPAPKDCVFA